MSGSMQNQGFQDCGGPFDPTPAHTVSTWERMPTTLEETAIISHLTQNPQLYQGKALFHIGIGNAALYEAIGSGLSRYVGLTLSIPEVEHFDATYGRSNNVQVILGNKYDPRVYPKIEGPFDIIVDINLKSFACCEKHFQGMIAFYHQRLRPRGVILTTNGGIHFGWPGNTRYAYTPGASLDPAVAQDRVLGTEGIKQLGSQYGFELKAVDMRGVKHWHGKPAVEGDPFISDETLLFLAKN